MFKNNVSAFCKYCSLCQTCLGIILHLLKNLLASVPHKWWQLFHKHTINHYKCQHVADVWALTTLTLYCTKCQHVADVWALTTLTSYCTKCQHVADVWALTTLTLYCTKCQHMADVWAWQHWLHIAPNVNMWQMSEPDNIDFILHQMSTCGRCLSLTTSTLYCTKCQHGADVWSWQHWLHNAPNVNMGQMSEPDNTDFILHQM